MTNRKIKVGALVCSLMVLPCMVLADDQWRISTGADYSSGDYGDDKDTKIKFIPLTVSYKTGKWKFKGAFSWVEIEGPGSVIGAGDGGVVIGDGNSEVTTESGIGDTWLSAMYSLDSFPVDLGYLDIGAKVKIPTADEDKGLGTGETDYTLQFDYFKPLGDITPFVTMAYKIKGDPPGSNLDNVFYLSVGSDFKYGNDLNIGFSLDYQEASSSSGDDQLELFGYYNRRLDSSWSLMLYGYSGLDDGSPDYGAGVEASYRF